ncbi:MarR family winged helix-turn-helix transcriptional regulator [Inquilinus sp. Marseille-Q2685]|uniref:MarR family winged helix-turn-helix transcriptional regulator n=1 Tax=Inquilinus sp. Marseille-Q2685 TaxID=2866581 RepID=UPI001CE46A3E|nr:MarR family winged helix-turn-helix transcriptional regulator [Inquilinus sp. Marseille-Q2685]
MHHPYYRMTALIERLHRCFLDVVKVELDRFGVQDINNVQSLILYNIGMDELTTGELTARGYYLGSNVSYNVKKMVENGYLAQERSQHDRRSTRVRLTTKGQALRSKLETMFNRQADALEGTGLRVGDVETLNATLRRLEGFWSGNLAYSADQPVTSAA